MKETEDNNKKQSANKDKELAQIKYQKKERRIRRTYSFLHVLLCNLLVRKYDLVSEKGKLPEGANLILANHVTNADQFFVAWYYGRRNIHFVAGENGFTVPLFRWLIVNLMGVIIHMRGVSSLNTIKEMTQHLKQGENVCIFPEGSTTFDGQTEKVDASIAKVAKISGANLILMKIEGGYFSKPRWGTTVRRGPVRISDYIIMKDDLAKMSPKDITDTINEKLYVDEYEVLNHQENLSAANGDSIEKNMCSNATSKIRYKGKALCRGLESCIYECPSCGKITSLTTTDTTIKCKCGFEALYDETGYLTVVKESDELNANSEPSQNEAKRYTITELCKRQRKNLEEQLVAAGKSGQSKLLFEDSLKCRRVYIDGKRENRGRVKVSVYTDCIKCYPESANGVASGVADEAANGVTDGTANSSETGNTISFSEIDSLFIFLRNLIDCKVTGRKYVYELEGDFGFNALKYRDLFKIYSASK